MEQFKPLQKIDPEDLGAHYNLAVLYHRAGMKKEAAKESTLSTIRRIDSGAPAYSLEHLRKHPERSTECLPWHVHIETMRATGSAAGQP